MRQTWQKRISFGRTRMPARASDAIHRINLPNARPPDTLDGHEEALLAVPRFHFRPLENGVGAIDPDPLDRGRGGEAQHFMLAKLLPRRLEGISDGEEHGRPHKQWGLADSAAPLNRSEILPLHIF